MSVSCQDKFLGGGWVGMGGGVWASLAFSPLRDFLFIWPKDPALSHQPAATTHTSPHCARPRVAGI